MMVFPSGVREISVPRNEIITVSFFDTPTFKHRSLGNSIMEDDGNMDMFDLVVVLEASCSNLWTPNKYVFNSSAVGVSSNGIEDVVEVFVFLHVESAVPLSVFMSMWNSLDLVKLHSKLKSERAHGRRPSTATFPTSHLWNVVLPLTLSPRNATWIVGCVFILHFALN